MSYRSHKYIWLLVLGFSLIPSLIRAQVKPIPQCENCLDSLLKIKFTANYSGENKHASPIKWQGSIVATDTVSGLLYVGNCQDFKLTVNGKKEYYGGSYQAKSKLSGKYLKSTVPISLDSGMNHLLIEARNLTNQEFTLDPIFLKDETKENLNLRLLHKNEPARLLNLISLLLLLASLIFALLNLFLYKNIYYKYYAFYLIVILLFLCLFTDEFLQTALLFPEKPFLYPILQILTQQLIYVFYAEFTLDFLEVKKKDKFLYKFMRGFQVFIIFIGLFNPLYVYFTRDAQFLIQHLHKLQFLVAVGFVFMLIRVLFKFKSSFKWFLAIGSLILFIGSFAELIRTYYLGLTNPRSFYYVSDSGFISFSIVQSAYVLEAFIFLLGIGFKSWKKEKSHDAYKEKTIEQLKEKELLKKQVNELLTEKLEKSKKQLHFEQVSSENERNKAKLIQSQLSSLQLQMNPHYLFNSLNSINDFIITKRPQEASEYLALYARMMRNILRNSDKLLNSLEQELQFCENYLNLESLRFENKFKYQVIRPRRLDLLEFKIPSMMLQPILENAVWHGVMPLKKNGKIILDSSESTAENIVISIVDNGKGLRGISMDEPHKSYGLNNIQEKIALFGKIYDQKIHFEIKDRVGETGVLVSFIFPNLKRKTDSE